MITGILLAAGSSSRMGFDKLTTLLAGKAAIQRSMELLAVGGCEQLVIVTSPDHMDLVRSLSPIIPFTAVPGGETRGDSVLNGLAAAQGSSIVVIHDAARCFTPASLVAATIESAVRTGSGVLALPVSDTVVRCGQGSYETIDRTGLWRTQTPQTFRYADIVSAYRHYDGTSTDDADLYQRYIGQPNFVVGSEYARKLTTAEDWEWAKEFLSGTVRTGIGYDTHQLVENRDLILGGVRIPYSKGLLGHSDADVLIHAVIDAIHGAGAMGDIGILFPDNDQQYKGIDSRVLLRRVADMVHKRDMYVCHIDAVILCQRPKLRSYIDRMRVNLAQDLSLSFDNVSVKATTPEEMNDEGRGLCISAQAIAQLKVCC